MTATTNALITALEELREAIKAQTRFQMDHGQILSQYEALNEQVNEARTALAHAMAERGINYMDDPAGELQISYRRVDGYYDPAKLPAHIQDNPNVVTMRVNKTAVDKAVKRGLLSHDEAEHAWVHDPQKPSVTIKPIVEGS